MIGFRSRSSKSLELDNLFIRTNTEVFTSRWHATSCWLLDAARHDPRVDQLVVAMIAFMCGGVPSARGVELLVRKMGADPADVRAFRYRGNGWPGRATALTGDGREHSLSYHESWGGVLSKHVQLRCKICADGVGMSADLVCADAWYGDNKGYPSFEEQDGRSLVLGRTPRGQALIDAAVASGHLQTEPLDGREIDRMQPYQMRRTRLTLSRLMAMRLSLRAATSYRGGSLLRFARRAGFGANLKSFLGTLARVARGRM
jgi:coenzyme F420 hydrogenase subunit beta